MEWYSRWVGWWYDWEGLLRMDCMRVGLGIVEGGGVEGRGDEESIWPRPAGR